MSPEVARRVISLFREIRPPERANYDLTPHETRLLKLFVEGHNYKTAAVEIGVAVTTVNSSQGTCGANVSPRMRPRAQGVRIVAPCSIPGMTWSST